MTWRDQLKGDPFPWLLEAEDPGPRYLTLRDLLDTPSNSSEMIDAEKKAHTDGPIAAILDKMHPDGYWEKPGPGYSPKYRSNVWSLILLAQLGASMEMDGRIIKAINYYLENAINPDGQISHSSAPSGTIDCLQGNMCNALLTLGCKDPKLYKTFDWMARTLTGEGMALQSDKDARYRWYAHQCGPLFACSANDKKPCAWGAAKVMLAFGGLPKEKRTPLIDGAIRQGVEFLFSINPVQALWLSPRNPRPNANWWKFGFPVFYISDLLQVAEALVLLSYGGDHRLAKTLDLIRSKQDEKGRWPLEFDYKGRTWGYYGAKNQPNKWVTLRALKVLKAVS